MFLVLAAFRSDPDSPDGASGITKGLTINYRLPTTDAVIVLRFKNNKDSEHMDFYSDTAHASRVLSSDEVSGELIEPTGFVFESKIRESPNGVGSAGDEYIYRLAQVQAKPWDIQFAYADTATAVASAVPSIAQVSVYAKTSCSITLLCKIPLGESRSIGSDSCIKSNGTCGSGRDIVSDLARSQDR